MTFSMPVRLLSPHPDTRQDTLTVTRGPIVYVAEGIDNAPLDTKYPHFEHVGVVEGARFDEHEVEIGGIRMVGLKMRTGGLYALEASNRGAYRVVSEGEPARRWKPLDGTLTLVPWFARANRGGSGRVRTSFARVDRAAASVNGLGE